MQWQYQQFSPPFKNISVYSFYFKCKDIVRFIRSRSVAADTFREEQEGEGGGDK